MTDEAVAKSFEGAYTSDGQIDNPDPTKAQWYPPAGVGMRLSAHETGGRWCVQIRVTARRDEVPHADEIEAARYIVAGKRLVSTPMVLSANLAVLEILSLDGDVVVHEVVFSDGSIGMWRCPP